MSLKTCRKSRLGIIGLNWSLLAGPVQQPTVKIKVLYWNLWFYVLDYSMAFLAEMLL